jgi:WD40 repeat protein/tRNA A-37 threonylcarbamoyl transferase component Bud32
MSVEPSTPAVALCPKCRAPLTDGELCPRCLLGDVLAVVEGPTLPKTTLPSEPRTLGEYELICELGQGGMGIVWKARQRRLNRIVALKLLRGNVLPGEVTARRLRREAEAAAQLKHPNIIVIHEVGEHDGVLYLSMELAEGGSLASWIKRVAFSAEDTAVLMAKVARGVHHAHEHHILHRDLKPANILLDADGEPRICDFGLARMSDMESSLTVTGEFLGTPAYLSPEQAFGEMKDLTPAADIYSLGALLYEMLTGHPPFAAENIHVLLRKVVEEDPRRPISHHSGTRIPFDLSTIALKCLEKDPHARYSSALTLAEDLERWVRGEPILARPVARAERVWKWARRKPVLAALWLACTALLVIVAVVATVMGVHLSNQQQQLEEAVDASHRQLARQLSESAQQHMAQGDYLRALPALAEAISIGTGIAALDDANRIRFGFLVRASPQLAQTWFRGQPITRAESTTDGKRIFLGFNQSVEVWDTVAGVRVGKEFVLPSSLSNAQFDSVAGRWVLMQTEDKKLLLWEPDSGELRDMGPGKIYSPPDANLQRSSNYLSYDENIARVRSIIPNGQVNAVLPHPSKVVWGTLLPKSNRALTCDEDGILYLWDAAVGNTPLATVAVSKNTKGMTLDAYHPDRRIAVLHRERDCWLLDCETGKVAASHYGLEDLPQGFGWGEKKTGFSWLILARNNEGVTLRELDPLQPKAGGDLLRWVGSHHAIGFRGAFAPASDLVATQSWNGSARVWKIGNGRPASPFVWQTATPGSCIIDPLGRWLLTRGDEPAARLWMLRDEDGAGQFPDKLDLAQALWYAGKPARLFAADIGGQVRAYSTGPERTLVGEVMHPEDLQGAGPAAGGAQLFTAGARRAMLWDAATYRPLGQPYLADADLRHTAAHPAGGRLAVVLADGQVVVWDALAGRVLVRFAAAARRAAFSADGRLILVIGDRSARTWDAATGQPVSDDVKESGGDVQALFSPDSHKVVQWSGRSISGQSRAKVWAADTGKTITLLPAHWLGVHAAAWSPDSGLIATGGNDLTILFCNAETGGTIAPPIKLAQKIAALGFSPNGLLVWSVADKEISVFDSLTGEPVTPRLLQMRNPLVVAMSPESQELVTVIDRESPRAWDLRGDAHSAAELRSVAHALSSHALVHGTSALRALSLVELRAAWEQAQKIVHAW